MVIESNQIQCECFSCKKEMTLITNTPYKQILLCGTCGIKITVEAL